MIIRHLVCIVLFFLKCLSTGLIKHVNYRKIPKISTGDCMFQRPFLRGLSTKGNLLFKIDWASLIVENLPFFLCFTLYLRAISKYKPPGGLIFGGAYFRNFTVFFCAKYVYYNQQAIQESLGLFAFRSPTFTSHRTDPMAGTRSTRCTFLLNMPYLLLNFAITTPKLSYLTCPITRGL